jgi:RNA polymerase sigma factor for flagellar operon FliA
VSAETSLANNDSSAPAVRQRASQAYAAQSREAFEEKLILDYLPLVRHVVQKVTGHFNRRIDYDNLLSAGTLGLVKAARAFDATLGVEFKTYAYSRIRGSIIDELRSESFASPTLRSQLAAIQKVYQTCCNRTGQSPKDEELAAELGMAQEDMYQVLEEARRQQFLSIHGMGDGGDSPLGIAPRDASPSPLDQAERKELMERMAKAILELPTRDRHLVMLYYERDLTMKEIAEVLEITESRVSQLHASALFKLSMKLKESA